jgi:hypothetical protein
VWKRRVRLELEVEDETAEEEERSERRIDEVRVLAEPAEPRAPREVALEQRARVHVRLARDRAPDARLDPAVQLAQPVDHHVVVVVAAGVARDGPARLAPAVLHRDDDRARHAGEWEPRVGALVAPLREVVHLPRVPRVEPPLELGRRLGGAEARDPREIEAEPVGLRLH